MGKSLLLTATACVVSAGVAFAEGGHDHAINQDGAILSAENTTKVASFDILAAHARRKGNVVTFHMTTAGAAGADQPDPNGALGGAPVWSYVWPTSLDPSAVGFEGGTGILAMQQQATRILTTHLCLTKTTTVIRQMTGCCGTAIGLS